MSLFEKPARAGFSIFIDFRIFQEFRQYATKKPSVDDSGTTQALLGRTLLQFERVDTKEPIEAEVTSEQFRALALEPADPVYVRPKSMRIFAEGGVLDYQI